MNTTPNAPQSFVLSRADRVTMRMLAVIIAAATLASVAWYSVFTPGTLTPGATSIELLTRTEVPNAGTPGGGDEPGIVSAGFHSAHVVATGLSDGVRVALGFSAFATALTIAAVGGAIAWLLFLVAAGRPFQRSLSWTTLVAGIALGLGPILSVGLDGLARMQAADELNPLVHDIFVVGFSVPALSLALPAVGIAVLTLASVFRRGAQLQRDTEGLV